MRLSVGIGLCGIFGLASAANCLAAGLPDGRVYEQVSPVDKHGGDVLQSQLRTVAAQDGSAVAFASLVGFGDVHGSGVAFDYVARRGDDGIWTTHGLTPEQQPGDYGLIILAGFESHYQLFSDDLSHGVFLARSPLTDSPNAAAVINLYRRDDVLRPGPGTYDLLTEASSLQAPDTDRLAVADASADFSHVTFESRRNLTPDAALLDPAQPKLYEWVNGSVHLVGVLPNGDPTISQAGQGAMNTQYTNGTISRDGRRVIFTAPPYTDPGRYGGVLYVRDDQGTASVADDVTVQVSASERTDCNDDPTCGGDGVPDSTPDPSNPGGVAPPATFWTASADGSKIFFTTSEQLTDDDVNHGTDLYRFDLDAPPGSRLTRLSVDQELSDNAGDPHNGHDVSGVLGASADGSYVYFTVTAGQLVAGGPTGGDGGPFGTERIFVWHDGTIHEVGGITRDIEQRAIDGLDGQLRPKWSRVTPDGKHIAFITEGSQELLSLYGGQEYDHNTVCPNLSPACQEIYVYDATANSGAGSLQCASCNPTGARATTDADFYSDLHLIGGAVGTFHQNHVLSDDGRFVFFNTAERLSPDDQNDATDAYEFDTTTGRVHLISSGRGSGDQVFVDASADGQDVFFTSREQLRSMDIDQSLDLYDARIGGVPDPGRKLVVPCTGDACKPAVRAQLQNGAPPTVAVDGGSDRLQPSVGRAAFALQLSAKQRRRLARLGSGHVRVVISRPGRVSVTLSARLGGRRRRVDVASARSRHAGPVKLLVTLDAAARRALARHRRLRLRLTATYSQSGATDVLAATLTRGRS